MIAAALSSSVKKSYTHHGFRNWQGIIVAKEVGEARPKLTRWRSNDWQVHFLQYFGQASH